MPFSRIQSLCAFKSCQIVAIRSTILYDHRTNITWFIIIAYKFHYNDYNRPISHAHTRSKRGTEWAQADSWKEKKFTPLDIKFNCFRKVFQMVPQIAHKPKQLKHIHNYDIYVLICGKQTNRI